MDPLLAGEAGELPLFPEPPSDGPSVPLILIVDDEAAILAGLQMFLEDEGYRVLSARKGTLALGLVRQEQPALVICDYMMPGMNGEDVLGAIRAQTQAEQRVTPILVLMSAAHQLLTRSVAADAWLTKPFELDIMADLLARLLSRDAA
ncbi:MAG: response regulator transcription factor [Ktedonobacterales bacterium]|nr:response regulator transcription factor [Ktedonobacterales bacterium]